tara:strand:- start:2438 stop:2728 length:291 start_codon:yes stop_codon:yes gene_type:complete
MEIVLKKSSRKGKKFMVKVDNKTIHFGQEGASDYTKNKDDDRKNKYIVRHTKRENWNKSGIKTAGFWSRWLLWNKKTLKGSIKDTEKRFDITIKKE